MSNFLYPLTNAVIAENIDTLGKLMDIFGENPFKVKAYTNAAYTIKKLPNNIADLELAEVEQLKIVGDSVRLKVIELLTTGQIEELESYKQQIPSGVLEMMKIKGLGPKKIASLWKDLGITSIGELEYACQENRLVSYKGFGQKTQADILSKIAFLKNSEGLYLWKQVDDSWQNWSEQFDNTFSNEDYAVVGGYQRQLPIVNGVEILFTIEVNEMIAFLEHHEFLDITIDNNAIQCKDEYNISWFLYYVASSDFALVQFRRNSSEHFYSSLLKLLPEKVEANNEFELFESVKYPFIPPYLREHKDIDFYENFDSWKNDIIKVSDIRGIIHSHSTWSDGINSIEEMAVAARNMCMEYLVISDHSKSAFYANGLSVDRIKAQHKEIDQLNEKLAPFKIFKSIEADILNDGSLDYEDEVLALFDLVIASIHSNLNMNEEKAMERLLKAIANPFTTILGHPTGRLLLSRPGYPINYSKIINACHKHGVVIEINAHPRRLDLDWNYIPEALDNGLMLSINPDAHAVEQLSLINYGVMAAQKGGLTKQRNLSSYTLAEFENYLNHKKETRTQLH